MRLYSAPRNPSLPPWFESVTTSALTGQGDPSIFFRIVIADEAARRPKLSDVAQVVALELMNEVKTDEQGIHAYFNFRSLSEQAQLNEPAWA